MNNNLAIFFAAVFVLANIFAQNTNGQSCRGPYDGATSRHLRPIWEIYTPPSVYSRSYNDGVAGHESSFWPHQVLHHTELRNTLNEIHLATPPLLQSAPLSIVSKPMTNDTIPAFFVPDSPIIAPPTNSGLDGPILLDSQPSTSDIIIEEPVDLGTLNSLDLIPEKENDSGISSRELIDESTKPSIRQQPQKSENNSETTAHQLIQDAIAATEQQAKTVTPRDKEIDKLRKKLREEQTARRLQLRQLESQLDKANQAIDAKESKLKNQRNDLKKELESVLARNRKLESTLKNLRNNRRSMVADLKKQVAQSQSKIESIKFEKSTLQNQLSKQENDFAKRLDSLNNEWSKNADRVKNDMAKVSAEKKKLKRILDELQLRAKKPDSIDKANPQSKSGNHQSSDQNRIADLNNRQEPNSPRNNDSISKAIRRAVGKIERRFAAKIDRVRKSGGSEKEIEKLTKEMKLQIEKIKERIENRKNSK
ncbi:MAG: hypothetical protein AAGA30_09670 [Planctomycetota bacterium]